MSDIRRARAAMVRRIPERAWKASPSERRVCVNNSGLADPIDTLVDKIARYPNRGHRAILEGIVFQRLSRASLGHRNIGCGLLSGFYVKKSLSPQSAYASFFLRSVRNLYKNGCEMTIF
jgi:hypothetical protein